MLGNGDSFAPGLRCPCRGLFRLVHRSLLRALLLRFVEPGRGRGSSRLTGCRGLRRARFQPRRRPRVEDEVVRPTPGPPGVDQENDGTWTRKSQISRVDGPRRWMSPGPRRLTQSLGHRATKPPEACTRHPFGHYPWQPGTGTLLPPVFLKRQVEGFNLVTPPRASYVGVPVSAAVRSRLARSNPVGVHACKHPGLGAGRG